MTVRQTLQLYALVAVSILSIGAIFFLISILAIFLGIFSKWAAEVFLEHALTLSVIAFALDVFLIVWTFYNKFRKEGVTAVARRR